MSIGKLFKFTFYSIITIIFFGAITAYFMGIVPTRLGIHSKIYTSSNVAMDNYDIVNYYLKKNAHLGDAIFNYKLGEDHWYFTSSSNMNSFKSKPNKYIPKFGGYCTYTMGSGYTYPPDPKVWHLHKGKLYFFKDKETKKLALADWKNVLDNAKLHWKN